MCNAGPGAVLPCLKWPLGDHGEGTAWAVFGCVSGNRARNALRQLTPFSSGAHLGCHLGLVVGCISKTSLKKT